MTLSILDDSRQLRFSW